MLNHVVPILCIVAQFALLVPRPACCELACGSLAADCCCAPAAGGAAGGDGGGWAPNGDKQGGDKQGDARPGGCCGVSNLKPASQDPTSQRSAFGCSNCTCDEVTVSQFFKRDRQSSFDSELFRVICTGLSVSVIEPTPVVQPYRTLPSSWALCSHQVRQSILCTWRC